eukprot:Gb_00941 [translate_table: standard]
MGSHKDGKGGREGEGTIEGMDLNSDVDNAWAMMEHARVLEGGVIHPPNHQRINSYCPGCKGQGDFHLAYQAAFICSTTLQHSKRINGYIIKTEQKSYVSVGNALANMYAKYKSLEVAYQLFDKMPERNIVSWSAMITGYVQIGHVVETLTLFHQMLFS